MKWFDTHEIKHQETLTPEQVQYLQRPSVTIFGPLNVLVRKQWDVLTVYIIVSVAHHIGSGLLAGGAVSVSLILLGMIILAFVWVAYFSVQHGRRLAWNRNSWKDFDGFQKSERAWTPWAWVMIGLLFISFVGQILTAL